jgi:tetratricopeptide (TPR) repeat protein
LAANGNYSKAIALLSDPIELKPASRLYIERAEINLKLKNYDASLQDFNKANALEECSGDYGLAKVYAMKGDASNSMQRLAMSMESEYKRSEKEIMLDPAFAAIENRSEWRQFWQKTWYGYRETAVSEIEYLISTNKLADARNVLAELKSVYLESEEAMYAEVLVNIASGKFDDAVKSASALASSGNKKEKYLRVLAKAQTGQLNFAGASTTYTKLIEMEVADAQLFIARAECFRKTGETRKAVKDVEQFMALYPENKEAIRLAGKLEIESGDNIKALEYFSQNIKLNPNDAECYVDRANSYFSSKSWRWAINDYSMSLDLEPENSDVWLNKGIAVLSSGNVNDACYDFKKAYSLGNQKAAPYINRNCLNQQKDTASLL